MKSKVFINLTIIAATAVPPCAVLTLWMLKTSSHELPLMLVIYLLAYIIIWLALIPAFIKHPRASWALCTLLYPIIVLTVLLLILSPWSNPGALEAGLLWFGPALYIGAGWITIPVSGMSATIAYWLTRNTPETENTDRGSAAPAS